MALRVLLTRQPARKMLTVLSKREWLLECDLATFFAISRGLTITRDGERH